MKEEQRKSTGVSFAPDVWEVMESERGDVPRSIIVNKALRAYYDIEQVKA